MSSSSSNSDQEAYASKLPFQSRVRRRRSRQAILSKQRDKSIEFSSIRKLRNVSLFTPTNLANEGFSSDLPSSFLGSSKSSDDVALPSVSKNHISPGMSNTIVSTPRLTLANICIPVSSVVPLSNLGPCTSTTTRNPQVTPNFCQNSMVLSIAYRIHTIPSVSIITTSAYTSNLSLSNSTNTSQPIASTFIQPGPTKRLVQFGSAQPNLIHTSPWAFNTRAQSTVTPGSTFPPGFGGVSPTFNVPNLSAPSLTSYSKFLSTAPPNPNIAMSAFPNPSSTSTNQANQNLVIVQNPSMDCFLNTMNAYLSNLSISQRDPPPTFSERKQFIPTPNFCFDGERSRSASFLYQLEAFQTYHQLSNVDMLRLVPTILVKGAFTWYEQEHMEQEYDWDVFKYRFRKQFMSDKKEQALKLTIQRTRQKPGESVLTFFQHIQNLNFSLKEPYNEADLIPYLVENLQPAIGTHLCQDCTSLSTLLVYAQRIERILGMGISLSESLSDSVSGKTSTSSESFEPILSSRSRSQSSSKSLLAVLKRHCPFATSAKSLGIFDQIVLFLNARIGLYQRNESLEVVQKRTQNPRSRGNK